MEYYNLQYLLSFIYDIYEIQKLNIFKKENIFLNKKYKLTYKNNLIEFINNNLKFKKLNRKYLKYNYPNLLNNNKIDNFFDNFNDNDYLNFIKDITINSYNLNINKKDIHNFTLNESNWIILKNNYNINIKLNIHLLENYIFYSLIDFINSYKFINLNIEYYLSDKDYEFINSNFIFIKSIDNNNILKPIINYYQLHNINEDEDLINQEDNINNIIKEYNYINFKLSKDNLDFNIIDNNLNNYNLLNKLLLLNNYKDEILFNDNNITSYLLYIIIYELIIKGIIDNNFYNFILDSNKFNFNKLIKKYNNYLTKLFNYQLTINNIINNINISYNHYKEYYNNIHLTNDNIKLTKNKLNTFNNIMTNYINEYDIVIYKTITFINYIKTNYNEDKNENNKDEEIILIKLKDLNELKNQLELKDKEINELKIELNKLKNNKK